MKKIFKYLVVAAVLFVSNSELKAQEPKEKELTVYFSSSMDCHECELKLTDNLKFEKGVKDLKIDLKSNTIKVVFKPTKNSPENLAKKIEKQGYDAIPISEKKYTSLISEKEKK